MKYVIVIFLAVLSLILTYGSKKIASALFGENAEDKSLRIKLVALAAGIIAFVMVIIL